MRALVTGGSGYFGSLLVQRLLEHEHEVGVLDIHDAQDRPLNVSFHRADVRDRAAVHECVRGYTHVFHNVAQVPLAKDRYLFKSVNVDGTENVLAASLAAKVTKVVYTSSSAVFGVPKTNPVTEETEPNPGEAYGMAKLEGEMKCHEYSRGGLDVSIIRPRTILGHGRLGIFQILFEWIREGRNVPVLGSGDNVYQFVHADDLANACILAAERPGPASYNIGAAEFGTMRETLEELCRHAQTGSRVRSVPLKPAVALMRLSSAFGLSPLGAYHALMYGRSMYFDTTKAKTELGFEAQYSNVEMFIQSYDWYIQNRSSYLAAPGQSHHRSPVKQGILALVSRLL
jgi:nucleoside-diphosphate-sugar epimerase